MAVSLPRCCCFITSKTLTSYLTPQKTVLLEKRIVAQLGRKPPLFYDICKFITSFTRSHLLSLLWARWIHCTLSYSV
jgi:hypothetical protein